MRSMRGVMLFIAGIILGSLGMQSLVAQQGHNLGHRINHVGIRVKDYQQSLDYYTKVLGFKEAYRFPSRDGSPSTTFLQVNKDTFIEMAPPQGDQPAGITHFGLYTDDAAATVAALRKAGANLKDPQASANSGSKLSNFADPNDIRIEINEQPEGSLMRKAMNAWK